MAGKAKFHTIDREGQADDIDELFEDLYRQIGGLNVLTAKGDIITYDGSNVVRLPAGSDGQVLTSRTSAAPGLVWENRASGGATGAGTMRYWFTGLPYGAL